MLRPDLTSKRKWKVSVKETEFARDWYERARGLYEWGLTARGEQQQRVKIHPKQPNYATELNPNQSNGK